MDLKLITNVGHMNGLGGQGMVYAGKTPGGSYFLAVYFTNEGDTGWTYIRSSIFQNKVAAGEAGYLSDLKISLFTDQALPEYVDQEGGTFPDLETVINGGTNATVPHKWSGESFYTIKPEGATDAEIAALRNTTGTGSTTTTTGGTTQTGTLGGIIPSATQFNRLFTDPLGFMRDNILFVVAVLAIVYYMRRKKKKPLWII